MDMAYSNSNKLVILLKLSCIIEYSNWSSYALLGLRKDDKGFKFNFAKLLEFDILVKDFGFYNICVYLNLLFRALMKKTLMKKAKVEVIW